MVSVAGQSLPSFGVMLQALEHAEDANVLSHPHILTMDNTKAVLSVGQKVPFPAQAVSAPGVGGSLAVATNYTRETVSLKLELTPHLNDSDSIRIELNGTIDDIPTQTAQAGGPTTNNRVLNTNIVVHDGETVVLGGLQKETDGETTDKIPLLGDIPLLGRLFQMRTKVRRRQDLLLVLTPYIIRGPEDLRRIFDRKDAERREFLERYSAFRDESAFERHVDYTRKLGLLAEIEHDARQAEIEAEAVRAAERALKRPATEGPVDGP
jgi:general secretion pathway protein D